MIAAGDYFQARCIYAEGAIGYLRARPRVALPPNQWSGNTLGYGFWEDAVYTGPAGLTGGTIQN